MTALYQTARAADGAPSTSSNTAHTAQISIPKLTRTIDLSHIGSVVAVRKLSFSPSGRYLAIVVDPELGKTDIVIWDMKTGKTQSHVHCPYQYGVLADHDLLWIRDGKVISFGAKRQWDPMTGESLPDNPAIGRAARLNKDGTKMLTIVGAVGDPSYIHVYDTRTWELNKLYQDGLSVVTAAWTADDNIVVGAGLTHGLYSKVIDGYKPQRRQDVALRLVDSSGKQATKTKWFPAIPTADEKHPFRFGFPPAGVGTPNFVRNKVFSAFGIVIDGKTLEIDKFSGFDSFIQAGYDVPGGFGIALSPDGTLIYLRGAYFKYGGHEPIMNSIADSATGRPLLKFGPIPTGGDGFSISPDGSILVVGLESSVQVFNIK